MSLFERALHVIVKAALPAYAEFGRENFAGDPLVQHFCEWAKQTLKIEAEIFVSWACPPDVSIVTSSNTNVLIRSERFDTLLIEYSHLKQAALEQPFLKNLILPSSMLRWTAEFLLGYRWPGAALYAAMRALELRPYPNPPNPFRDETLASVHEVERTAFQCFCLAHELAHLIPNQHDEISLDTYVDGLSLSRHITRDIEEGNAAHVATQMIEAAKCQIDPSLLLREINADLLALELVAVFVANTFNVAIESALRVTLAAYEAQSFLYATKNTCLLLKRYAGHTEVKPKFTMDDWVAALQVSIRARCVLRRAGILLSRWSTPNEKQTAATINRFVSVVDGMFLETMTFRADLAAAASREFENLLTTIPAWKTDEGRAFFFSLIDIARNSSEIKLDLFYMLVAMGFSGGTEPIAWLEHLFNAEQSSF